MRGPLGLRRIAFLAAAAGALLVGSATVDPPIAGAHGTLDQTLSGDPGCAPSVLRATASSASPIQQEFVPSTTGLQAVELCVTRSGAPSLTLKVREGTVASPGATLATIGINPGTTAANTSTPLPGATANTQATPVTGVVVNPAAAPAGSVTSGAAAGAGTRPGRALPNAGTGQPLAPPTSAGLLLLALGGLAAGLFAVRKGVRR